jgi:site-specific DNA-methyltransferase (adenine-specific)
MNIDLRLGDCLEVLKTIPDNSIDSVVTDPPYGIGFMGKAWDTFEPDNVKKSVDNNTEHYQKNIEKKKEIKNLKGRKNSPIAGKSTFAGTYDLTSKGKNDYQEWCYEWGKECFRILKPGGHLLASNSPRMYHRMAIGLEDAGFEIRDQIMWVYGSGFPKSHNIGKAIDKIEGNEREVLGYKGSFVSSGGQLNGENTRTDRYYEKGNSDWEGWGTALKPAHEPIVMARKPLSEKSIAENVLKHGTGGINIDGSRITIGQGDKTSAGHRTCNIFETEKISGGNGSPDYETHEGGRFPANIIFDEEAGQLLDEQSGPTSQGHWAKTKTTGFGEFGNGKSEYKGVGPKDKNKDKGGASRFFYCPKAAKKDRNEGLDEFEEKKSRKWRDDKGMKYTGSGNLRNEMSKNIHPTVKPTDLMRYLINLITPPNGTILDPFMGSGSTGKAAVRCGVNFIGIEREQEYMDIAKARIEHEQNKPTQGELF